SRLSGMVVNQTNKGIPGVVVIATNQVTRRVHRTKSGSSGEYSLNLPTGAYRITVGAPYAARFLRVSKLPKQPYVTADAPYLAVFPPDNDYKAGNFNDVQENVIIVEGKETKLNIPAEIPKAAEKPGTNPNDKQEQPSG